MVPLTSRFVDSTVTGTSNANSPTAPCRDLCSSTPKHKPGIFPELARLDFALVVCLIAILLLSLVGVGGGITHRANFGGGGGITRPITITITFFLRIPRIPIDFKKNGRQR